MTKYNLYIGKYKELPKEVEYSYYSVKSKYLLAFHNEPIEDMQVVPLEKQGRLEQEEKAWLAISKSAVNMKAQAGVLLELADSLNGFLAVFEKELKVQKRKD